MAKKVSVINFKGGVGKTTITLHLAAGIEYFYKKRVLIVDVDHQSSLSIVCLRKRWEEAVNSGRTINRVFEHFTKPNQPLPGREIITPAPYKNDYPNLDIVSSSLELDDLELELASSSIGEAVFSEFQKRTLLSSWIDKNNLDKEYDYIFFDCPPATKLVSQNAISASDYYIVPVIPDAISSRGLEHLVHLLKNKIDKKTASLADFLHASGKDIPASYVRETKLGGVIISKLKVAGNSKSGYTNDHTQHLQTITSKWNKEIITPYIEEGTGIPEAMAEGFPIYDKTDNKNIEKREYFDVFENLVHNTVGRIV